MHPWTDEEKLRERNTGFVCFMNREDAEEAIAACCETDVFQNGRRLMLRWGIRATWSRKARVFRPGFEVHEHSITLLTQIQSLDVSKMQRVASVVPRAWSSWSVYDETFIQKLRQVFDGKRTAEDMKTGNKKGLQVEKKDGGSESLMSVNRVDAHAPDAVADQGANTTALSEDNAKFHNAEVKVSTPLEQENDGDDDVDGEPLADDAMLMMGTTFSEGEGEPPHNEDADLDSEPVSDADADGLNGSPLLDGDNEDGGNAVTRERAQDTGTVKSEDFANDLDMGGEDAEINDDDGNADDVDGEEIDIGDVDVDGEELTDDVDGEEVNKSMKRETTWFDK
jgi:hypothetical protein